MPWPMVPVPTTATGLLRSSAVMCAILPHDVFHGCGGPPCPDRSFGYSNPDCPFLPSSRARRGALETRSWSLMAAELTAHQLIAQHRPTLDQALEAIRTRAYWSPHPEHPKAYGENGSLGMAEGKAAFDALLGTR